MRRPIEVPFMKKSNKYVNPNEQLSKMIDVVLGESDKKESDPVDIITFCEDPRFLNLKNQDPPFELWPMQKIVLKLFYRGSRGNEHLQLDDEEMKILEDIAATEELDYNEDQGGFKQIIDKYKRWNPHNTMLLIMGRRSSKTLMVSIIAAYQAYLLLELKNPHKYYRLTLDKPIAILNVAVSEQQAYDPLFKEIKSRMARAPYFADKINFDKITQNTMYLLTESDKKENARRQAEGINIPLEGSIVLKSGHSNSASLRGQAAICILFDEFAHFMTSSGKQSGDEVYHALVPSVKQFGLDGKVVLLSDPRGKEGMFWRLFEMSQQKEVLDDKSVRYLNEEILGVQLPTWRMNPNKEFGREELERTEKQKDPQSFFTTWAARFVGEAGEKIFTEEIISNNIDFGFVEPVYGNPKYNYFIHLDPATTSHNYALAMVHPIPMVSSQGEVKTRIVVDIIKFWKPSKEGPVNITAVENSIRDLCKKFRVAQVSFDSFQSAQTIQRLSYCGIKAKETPFTATHITAVYGELRNLLINRDIVLPPNQLLIGEMKNLRYKFIARGFKRMFDPKSEYPSDDCCDALAGACYEALHVQAAQQLPRSVLVRTGFK